MSWWHPKFKGKTGMVIAIYDPWGDGEWILERWVASRKSNENGDTLYDYDTNVPLPKTWFCAARIETD